MLDAMKQIKKVFQSICCIISLYPIYYNHLDNVEVTRFIKFVSKRIKRLGRRLGFHVEIELISLIELEISNSERLR